MENIAENILTRDETIEDISTPPFPEVVASHKGNTIQFIISNNKLKIKGTWNIFIKMLGKKVG